MNSTTIPVLGLISGAAVIAGLGSARAGQSAGTESPIVRDADAATAGRPLSECKVVVLDIRPRGENTAGHIPNAPNIDYHAADFEAQLEKLDKGKPICCTAPAEDAAPRHSRSLHGSGSKTSSIWTAGSTLGKRPGTL